ncbi:MAG: ketopantoate reductase family protein [Bacteroides sp.]
MKDNYPNICVAGIGGVGGFIGAAFLKNSIPTYLYVRSSRIDELTQCGITVKSRNLGNFIVHPHDFLSEDSDSPCMDVIFICVKLGSLEQICHSIAPFVNSNTILVPVMNGIVAGNILRKKFPDATVIDSVIYIITTLTDRHTIVEDSASYHIHIGSTDSNKPETDKAVHLILSLFEKAQIPCIKEDDIYSRMWQKFILNCAFNVITAYYNTDTDGIRNNPARIREYITLMNEASLTARANGVYIPPQMEAQYIDNFLNKQIGSSTSSLKKDMEQHKPSELDYFCGALLEKASEVGITLPATTFFYNKLKERNNYE